MKYLIGRPKRPTMKSVLIRYAARLFRLRERASSFRSHGVLYQHVDREKMGDHVTAVVPVMLVRLNGPVGIFGTSQPSSARTYYHQRRSPRQGPHQYQRRE